ncbi:MAG: hypothetical protein FJ087_08795 [Deltaproteobacteria bacterium]|nr:hypothetical protein [Deltaproteobacteria bacterium]
MRTITILSAVVALAATGAACKGTKKAEPAPAAAPAEAPAPPKPTPPKSAMDEVRDAVRDFVSLLADCDKDWFADVKPERLDNWDLPVNVKAMEANCDRLLPMFETVLDKGAFRNALLDDFIRAAALASDHYLFLGFRSKKVGVRDKVALKAEIAGLRDGLRADVAKLKESVGQVLGMDDVAMRQYSSHADALPKAADAALSRLRADVKQWIEQPVKDAKPTWRYSLRTSETIASRAVAAVRFKGVGGAMTDPADGLAGAFASAVKFYTGNYFDTEEKEAAKYVNAVIRADGPYRLAARKALKP